MKYAFDGKLMGFHNATLAAAEKERPSLADSYCDIIEKRLNRKPGEEYLGQKDAKTIEGMAQNALNSFRRMVIREEGDEALTMEDVQSTMAVDNTMYQTLAMQARLPYHLREDPEYDDVDPPLRLSYRVV